MHDARVYSAAWTEVGVAVKMQRRQYITVCSTALYTFNLIHACPAKTFLIYTILDKEKDLVNCHVVRNLLIRMALYSNGGT